MRYGAQLVQDLIVIRVLCHVHLACREYLLQLLECLFQFLIFELGGEALGIELVELNRRLLD
jgi:hypothetical protein